MKEIKFSPTIQDHDIKHKVRNIDKLLKQNEHVRVSVKFSNLESKHPETGQRILDLITSAISVPFSITKRQPLENKIMFMVVAPTGKKKNENKQQ
jgi:translation initiation factor IF-3